MTYNIKFFTTSIFVLFYFTAFSQDISSQTIQNKITSITVFLNNAEIHRQGKIQIPTGKSEVIFENISSRILDKGIRINTSNKVKVYAVLIQRNANDIEENSKFSKMTDAITEIQNEKDAVALTLEVLNKRMLFIESNMTIQNNTFARLDEAEGYFSNKISHLQTQIINQRKSLKEWDKQLKQLLKKKTEIEIKLRKSNTNLKIILENETATECQIDLKYLVSNAVWTPSYAIRAKKDNPKIDIEYQAQIYNDTGVDWDNIPITLAIIDSSDDINIPDLNIWNLEEENNQYSKRKYLSSTAKRHNHENGGLNDDDGFVEHNEFEIDDLSTRFELKNVYKIPSDATPHLIDVSKYQKEVEFYNLAIPKIKSGGFLIARILNWESLGLIDGVASLYYNNAYQGFTNLKTQQLSDTLDLSLGRESSVSISRKKISSKNKKSLMGFSIKENLTFEIVVKNNKRKDFEIQLKDQIPISTSKDVEVTPKNLSHGKLDPLTGEVTWVLKLVPGETKRIILSFSIKYPKNKKNSIKYHKYKFMSPRFF